MQNCNLTMKSTLNSSMRIQNFSQIMSVSDTFLSYDSQTELGLVSSSVSINSVSICVG